MAKRLLKVAKDLNVELSKVVGFLNQYGFEIENSPRAKVSDEAYEMLLYNYYDDLNDYKICNLF